MAHKKGQGSSRSGRASESTRRGGERGGVDARLADDVNADALVRLAGPDLIDVEEQLALVQPRGGADRHGGEANPDVLKVVAVGAEFEVRRREVHGARIGVLLCTAVRGVGDDDIVTAWWRWRQR